MTITFPRALPAAGGIRRVRPSGAAAVAQARSPFSLRAQTHAHPGNIWRFSVVLVPKLRADAELWTAWLLSLNGREGSFLLGDPAAGAPRGTPTGAPVIDGAGQTGRVLATRGWTPSSTGNLLVGDYLQLGSGATARLYKVTGDSVDADGAGLAAIDIWPDLRNDTPGDGAAIVTANAVGRFKLASNETAWDVDEALIHGIGFDAVEDL